MLVSENQLRKEINLSSQNQAAQKKERLSKSKIAVEALSSEAPHEPVSGSKPLDPNENKVKRKEMISAKGFEPAEFAYERAIGKNDSLYSNFTELIALTKRKVGRIVIIEDGKKTGYATGFMVSARLMLTNWHVFRSVDMAEESEVHFFYEYNVYGRPVAPAVFRFDTSAFYNNEDLDYCFVAVQPQDITQTVGLNNISYLFLDRTLGKIGGTNEERLNIIHHPQGDYKQISIRENLFVGIDDTKIYYETDTAQGSSGSPVFNDQWQVVGLHHKSIAKMSADGRDFLDKDDQVIPIVNDKIDLTRVVWLRNEGMRVSVVLNHLLKKHPDSDVLSGLAIAPSPEALTFETRGTLNSNTDNKEFNNAMSNDSNNILISIPPAVLSANNTIDIRLTARQIISDRVAISEKGNPATLPPVSEELLQEAARSGKEQEMDFSKCRGYSSGFLGVDIPLPQPKKSIEKQIALLKNKTNELKYFKYSVIFNAFRKMPLISAINVEGDASKRLDDSKRKDSWLKDKRIDLECQLTDKFYAGSNFDKGHMSRWEDANWDNTEEDALRNGIYTCFYTNACPQVVDLNRAGGFWGKLEKAVLEKGIKNEAGKLARMSVFNGPIFNEDKDRIFKGVAIPMEFFKIILWLGDDMKLRATGFKLTQELLVDHIKFDESMRIDEEALDIDKNVDFKKFRCSIKRLGELTSIDFSKIEKYDTFKSSGGNEESLIINEESLVL